MKRKTKIVVSNSQYKTQQWRKLAACVVAVANTPNTNTIYNILNTDAYPQHKTHNIGPSMKYGKYKPPYKTAIPHSAALQNYTVWPAQCCGPALEKQ